MSSLFLFTTLLAGTETIAMTALTAYSKHYNPFYLLIGILIYGAVIPYLIINSLKFDGIGTVNFLWNIITTVAMIVIGYYIFKEKVNQLHYISFFLGIAAIIVLYLADKGEKS
jgi:multidrug transporter EmrE-like cation transporter